MAPDLKATQRPRFSQDEAAAVNAFISQLQTGGKSLSAKVDRDFLLEDGNCDLFMLHYFPRDFLRWEPLNMQIISFLEGNREGMMWLPGGHGKTTTLLRWMIYVMCREPQVAMIYVEKNEPTAFKRSYAIMQQLESNKDLIRDFGVFKGTLWSARNFTIAQRPFQSDWPTLSVYGAKGAALGNRCNIMIVDDPVTTDNSQSEALRDELYRWYTEAAATCPSPLPLSKRMNYLKKLFLSGTTFHLDDLYHRVQKANPDIPHLYLKAVNMETHDTLSDRFFYQDPEELKQRAEEEPAMADRLQKYQNGQVENLYEFRMKKGIRAFNTRYQNQVTDPSLQKFPEPWFRGGHDEMGEYDGCLDDEYSLASEDREGFRYVTGVDPAAGGKSRDSARFACVTLGAHPDNPQDIFLVDIDFGRYPLESDNPARKTQLAVILDHVKRYNSRIALETNNIQQIYAQTIRAEAQRRGTTVSISGHWTSKGTKIDPELGIEAMCPMVENGKLHLPYAEMSDRKKVEEVIQEFVNWGSYPTQDILMAFWFAWRVLTRILKRGRKQAYQPQKLPSYRRVGDKLVFPDHWTEAQIAAYLGFGSEEDDEEEDVA